ncbi:hypothetical protein C2134_07435 [Chromobacterium sinusclupearum]|uniref:Uncharacterized protein n=1 Tax=Chromobacterium sinusclupearum TaxID=2077146 RepID=A0A2K4MQ64_9NEIS|nr:MULTISPECIES: hypothetical protein [Chromobacterium]POA99236.1 hypothetical protein C2134_07435 [Chromobacterium sinusclupearum]
MRNLAHHILPTSATMLGVCMTVIPIIKLMKVGHIGTMIDELLADDSVIFLISAVLSYLSIRRPSWGRLERHADIAFVFGLCGMSVCAVLLSFELL